MAMGQWQADHCHFRYICYIRAMSVLQFAVILIKFLEFSIFLY